MSELKSAAAKWSAKAIADGAAGQDDRMRPLTPAEREWKERIYERLLKVLDEYPRGRAVHRALLAGSAARTLLVVTLLRVPPNGPFAMTNLLLAATGVSWGPYLLGSLIGLAPRVAAAVVVGASLSTLDLRHLERGGPAYVTIGLSVAAVIALGWIANRGLRRLST